MRAWILLAGVVLASVCGGVAYAERQVQVTVSVIDATGQPIADCPIHVASRSWKVAGDGIWPGRSDANGKAILQTYVSDNEAHLLFQVAFPESLWPTDETFEEWRHDALAMFTTYSVPRPAVIDVSNGAAAYEATIQLRERAFVYVSAIGPDGQRLAELGVASVEFLAGQQGESLVDPVRIEGVPKTTESHLVVYGGPPFDMMPSVVRLDVSDAAGPSTAVTTELDSVPAGTVSALLELGNAKPMIYDRVAGKRSITIISEDVTYVRTLFLRSDPSDSVYTVVDIGADGREEESTPLLPPGRYAIAPGQLSYPAAFNLFMFM
ncbi:MAG: hypothetical protein HRU13_10735 [Phycisphaerales bacterium]|nr:hypothetical protein [Phycisphaerales bacterium]